MAWETIKAAFIEHIRNNYPHLPVEDFSDGIIVKLNDHEKFRLGKDGDFGFLDFWLEHENWHQEETQEIAKIFPVCEYSSYTYYRDRHWRQRNLVSEENLVVDLEKMLKHCANHIPHCNVNVSPYEDITAIRTATSMEAKIVGVGDILVQNLKIPDYQRPYCWGSQNVRQLLEDIAQSMISGRKQYRLGSLIIHQDEQEKIKNYWIVDGQQRLTTLVMINMCCFEQGQGTSCVLRETLKFNRQDSLLHIKENYAYINTWLMQNTPDKGAALWQYISNSCNFVLIVVKDLSEAFQMFDTQNGRGKSLEAYNLLKAYHIRAMEQNTQDEKILCDRRWESAAQYDATPSIENDPNVDILKQLFGEQVFRSRLWCRRNEAAYTFSKKDIGEFKGFTVDKNHPVRFPFQNPQLLQYLTSKFYKSVLEGTIGTFSRFKSGDSENINPFVNINQHIVNGQAFFDYIETYVEMYKRMFLELGSYQLEEFKKFFYQYCLAYDVKDNWEDVRNREDLFRTVKGQACRSGDSYLREIYKSLCMVIFDKFGEDALLRFYKPLYRLVYRIRLERYAVRYQTAAEETKSYFRTIYLAHDLADLAELDKAAGDICITKKDKEYLENNEIIVFIRGE